MYEMESDDGITTYVYQSMPGALSKIVDDRTYLYDKLDKFGYFENKRCEFESEIISIILRFMESGFEPSLSEIQSEYLSLIYSEIFMNGCTLNRESQEIFDTYDLYCSNNNYSIEDEIKEVLDRNGLSSMYLRAPEDVYALVTSYFGAQAFFPDIVKHLLRRRVD